MVKNLKQMPLRRFAPLVAVLAVAGLGLSEATSGAAAEAAESTVQRKQSGEIKDLTKDLERNEKEIERILLPVSVLIGILALGGGLGVVFSIRDQRRVSQLHELTVAGEVSSQRRSEQSFASFLEQSQTTLSLVNDTLELAKEATDRAAKSMEEKAQLRVDAIEERAQKLMLDVFTSREFELVVEDPVRRAELHAIGDELRALEGYLNLQDIKLKDYAKFVKALDQFLLDDTDSAIQALQLASQDRVVGDLRMFIEYWLGYMLTTVGSYEEAVSKFQHDEMNLTEHESQWFQLERIIGETQFFLLAKAAPGLDSESDDNTDPRDPHQRYETVAVLLDRLAKLAAELGASVEHRAKLHTQLELARTRADVYEWVAYDEKHIDDPLDNTAIETGKEILSRLQAPEKPSDLVGSALWIALDEADLLRYWALTKAQEICEHDLEESNPEVDFALAECYFKLRNGQAEVAFDKAVRGLQHQFGEHREKRREVALHQSLLISHCRHLTLKRLEETKRREEMGQEGGTKEDSKQATQSKSAREEFRHHIDQSQRDTQEKLNEMRQRSVTVFSHIQRRNLTQDEFRVEIKKIVEQEKVDGLEKIGEPTGR
jgi:tetratricopeptide (TPR) repeat protein